MARPRTYTLDQLKEIARKRHNDEYDYSLIEKIDFYHQPVPIIHRICGKIFQLPLGYHASSGTRCPCLNKYKKMNTESFLAKCHKQNLQEKFDLSKVNYVKSNIKICIGCLTCSREFWSTPNNFLRGKGCPECSGTIINTEIFHKKLKRLYGDTIDVSDAIFDNMNANVLITCTKHQEKFEVKTYKLYTGAIVCKRCAYRKGFVSKKEIDWLDKLQIPINNRQKCIMNGKRKYLVDALVDKTIYEFYGEYWHGDPRVYPERSFVNRTMEKTMDQLYEETIEREFELHKLGYEVKFVWEYDWNNGDLFSKNHPILYQKAG